MNSIRSAKTYYIAAFILGAIIALLITVPGHSAETFAAGDVPMATQSVARASELSGALQ